MPNLEFRTVIGTNWGDIGTDIRSLSVLEGRNGPMVLAAGGPAGGVISFSAGAGGRAAQVNDQVAYSSWMATGVSGNAIALPQDNGQSVIIGAGSGPFGYAVSDTGQIGTSFALSLPGYAGSGGPVLTSSAGGTVYLVTGAGRVQEFEPRGQNGYRAGQITRDTEDMYLADPVALQTIRLGDSEFLLSLSAGDVGLTAFRIGAGGGALSAQGSVGVETGLGLLHNPTGMEMVEIGGRCFVLIASAPGQGESGALSVVELFEDGGLQVVDHVLDTRNTRFGQVESLSVTQVGGWTYVVAGGGDSGLSLFTLMPGGRLLHLDTLADTLEAGLEQISALATYVAGDALQVLTSSQSTVGVSRLELSLAGQGVIREVVSGRLDGTGGGDMLIGGRRDSDLHGGGGGDIIVDGRGSDRLTGGTGADLFVLGADGLSDVITDFRVGVDRLDLTGVPMLYDASRLQVLERAWGAILVFPGGEQTEIRSVDGWRLSTEDIQTAIAWSFDRPPLILFNELFGTDGADSLMGGAGTDLITGLAGADTLNGLNGDDRISGGLQGDVIFGGNGGDDIRPGLGPDRVYGGAGDDEITDMPQGGPAGADTVGGGDGNDTISLGGGWDYAEGGAGDDWLYAGWGNDTLLGGDNDDTLLGVGGFDSLDGQDGRDVIYGGNGNDLVRGGNHNDTLLGGSNADLIEGGDGNDRLEGQHGFDTLDGGPGNDWLHGGLFDDTLRGGDGNDTLIGANDDDRLEGQGGRDMLDGGDGNDWLHGGNEDDLILGGGNRDTLIGARGNDSLEGQYGMDVIDGGFGEDWIHGGAMGDTIEAGGGNDTVNGGSGPDLIRLGEGDDVFRGFFQGGALGRDTIWGDAGNDRINASAGKDVAHGQADDDFIFGGRDDDLLTGGNGFDTLSGGPGGDTLHGGGGNDRLEGGRDTDDLTGGAGRDVFIFRSGDGRNIVQDFQPGLDRLEFDVAANRVADLKIVEAPRGLWIVWERGEVLLEGLSDGDIGGRDMTFL